MDAHYFIGIAIPGDEAKKLASQRDGWKLGGFKRYPPAEDLHLTLLFIGAASEDQVDAMKNALGEIEATPFRLTVTGTGTFGPEEKPRVVYAAVEENEALRDLQEMVTDAIRPLKVKPDEKPFNPHITLANKRAGDEGLPAAMPVEELSFEVSQFQVFRIQPKQQPRYVPVADYPLTLKT